MRIKIEITKEEEEEMKKGLTIIKEEKEYGIIILNKNHLNSKEEKTR